MLRFATRAVAAALLVRTPLVRWQTTSADAAASSVDADATTTAAASSNSSSSGGQAAMTGGRNRASAFRAYTPMRLLPKFEIFDVRDNPAHGTMTRVSVDGKQLLVSQFPQLGPRKLDPNDQSPQFDTERRISVRLRHRDLGALVGVVEERTPSYRMTNNAYDLTFAKTATGYTLRGTVHRAASQTHEEWAMQFDRQFAVMLEHFLQAALTHSFGFEPYYSAAQTSTMPPDGARATGGGGNYNNNYNYNNNNNNARRNRNRGNAASMARA